VREQGFLKQQDIVDRIWCPQVGLVADTASGQLIASNALSPLQPGSDVSSFGKYLTEKEPIASTVPKISEDQARESALKVVPGRVTKVELERKRGKIVYVVEIRTDSAGEKDVLVDIESGEVVGTE